MFLMKNNNASIATKVKEENNNKNYCNKYKYKSLRKQRTFL